MILLLPDAPRSIHGFQFLPTKPVLAQVPFVGSIRSPNPALGQLELLANADPKQVIGNSCHAFPVCVTIFIEGVFIRQ